MRKSISTPAYSITVFGTDDNSFNVTASLLVKGGHASLVNAGFTRATAKEIVRYLQDEKLALDEVFIIHGDPDYYFGLEQVIRAFPDAVAYSTKETAAHITDTVLDKLNVWGGQLKNEAPDNIILPKILTGSAYSALGETFELSGTDPNRINLWDAKNKVMIGGIDVFNEIHVFLADTGTEGKLNNWLDRLDFLKELGAQTVIPSHGTLGGSFDARAIDATADYLKHALAALKDNSTSSALGAELFRYFPDYPNKGVVELGAKVLTKEIVWG